MRTRPPITEPADCRATRVAAPRRTLAMGPMAPAHFPTRRARGSVLIIVLWIAFGLVSIALYFGHAMVFEFRAADQNAAGVAADEAIDGAARYLCYVLTNIVITNVNQYGTMPATNLYRCEAVPVGDAAFWLVGRGDTDVATTIPAYGLVDEASKLNLNTATQDMLSMLPRMTPELAAAIIDWRDTNSDVTTGGAEDETYLRRNPPYYCKNAKFESVDELRLVAGATPEILLGEDVNLNGVLDPNENDGNASLPPDNGDGKLDPGIMEYVTVFSGEANLRADGSPRINVNAAITNELAPRLRELFGQARANAIQMVVTPEIGRYRSVLQFYLRSRMTLEEFAQIAGDLAVTNAPSLEGLVNVNTASTAVLACLPGIGADKAPQLVAYRRANSSQLTSVAWVTQVLDATNAIQAGPYLTTTSSRFSADVVALGGLGRGYRRTYLVFDISSGEPKIVYRRDRSRLGWALGNETRQPWYAERDLPTWRY